MSPPLPWGTFAALASVGLLAAALSLAGAPAGAELGLWVLAGAAWIAAALRAGAARPLLALAAVGLAAGLLTGVVQAAFADALLAGNAGYRAQHGAAATPEARGALLAAAVAMGLAWGALAGLLALGWLRLRGRSGATRPRRAGAP